MNIHQPTALSEALDGASTATLRELESAAGVTLARLERSAQRPWHPAPWLQRTIADVLNQPVTQLFPQRSE